MWSDLPADIDMIIVDKALEFGASLAGLVDAASVLDSPSHKTAEKSKLAGDAKSLLILALEVHPSEPSLDWWDGKPGRAEANRRLISIGKKLETWLQDECDVKSEVLAYSTRKGGIYLKDAAVLAGLGILGKNNLLITKEFGPRVRLGAVALDLEVSSPAQLDFAPCESCSKTCRTACPQEAFVEVGYSAIRCRIQMDLDEENEIEEESIGKVVKYCRQCEINCIVGK